MNYQELRNAQKIAYAKITTVRLEIVTVYPMHAGPIWQRNKIICIKMIWKPRKMKICSLQEWNENETRFNLNVGTVIIIIFYFIR